MLKINRILRKTLEIKENLYLNEYSDYIRLSLGRIRILYRKKLIIIAKNK